MARLNVSFRLVNLRRDVGGFFHEDEAPAYLLTGFNEAARQALSEVPELSFSQSIDRVKVAIEVGEGPSPATSAGPSDPVGYMDFTVQILIDRKVAFGYRDAGSPAQVFIEKMKTAFGVVFDAVPPSDVDPLERLGVTADDFGNHVHYAASVTLDAPRGVGRPIED